MLKTGFARVDITPTFGTKVAGYFEVRPMDGVLDPLYASAIAFDDGEKKAVLFALDHLGIRLSFATEVRKAIADATGLPYEAISLTCSHTHLGPESSRNSDGSLENEEYNLWFQKRLCDAAVMALEDVVPTEMLVCRGRVEDVAFVRRFRMKDGSVQTNPGLRNPNIDHVLGNTDEESQLLILKRENKPEIGIVTFQVHPDVIGGCKVSADYIKFVRDTYETLIPNSYCVYLNGAQGDTNHIDVSLDAETDLVYGYERAKYMGKKIACSVISNYELAKPVRDGKVNFKEVPLMARYNKGTPDQLEDAIRRSKIYQEQGLDAATPEYEGMRKIEVDSEAERIVRVKDFPDEVSLPLVAISAGGAVFSTVPGEPFTDVGVQIKAGSKFDFTITTCCSNGDEAYFPTQSAFDEGGYEVVSTDFAEGTAEQIVRETLALINSL